MRMKMIEDNKYLVKVCALLKAPPKQDHKNKPVTKPKAPGKHWSQTKPKSNKFTAKIANSKKLKPNKVK